jgi:hypothetical protein
MFLVAALAFEDLLVLGGGLALASLSCVAIGAVGFVVSQGGLGAYPLLVSAVLSLYGISPPVGLAVGWVIWAVEEAMYLVLGLVSALVFAFKKKRTERIENHPSIPLDGHNLK